ncbi:MAG: hypothetical protein RLZZ77_1861 [Bacteroidota bacterium]|jgi:predicted nucleotidyltransferase
MKLIESNIQLIRELCAKHRVRRLFVFGSVLRDTFSNKSDIDFLVDFADVDLKEYADNYFELKEKLEALLKCPVDLLEEKGIRNPFFREEIEKEKQLIYGE